MMTPCPIQIRLTPEEMAKCHQYAEAFLQSRANGGANKRIADSMKYIGKWDGRDFDVMSIAVQREAKAGECAVAKALGLPISVLSWDADGPDDGADLTAGGYRIDVKAVSPNKRYLLWPLPKNDMFENKKFDAFISTRGEGMHWKIDGCISKKKFFDNKLIAGPGMGKLEPGTWYIEIGGPLLTRHLDFFFEKV